VCRGEIRSAADRLAQFGLRIRLIADRVERKTQLISQAGKFGIEPQRLLEEMHLVTPDRRSVYHGFGAFRWMARHLPLLVAFAPILYLPGVPFIGQRAYLWVARHRYQLVPCHNGVCSVPPAR